MMLPNAHLALVEREKTTEYFDTGTNFPRLVTAYPYGR